MAKPTFMACLLCSFLAHRAMPSCLQRSTTKLIPTHSPPSEPPLAKPFEGNAGWRLLSFASILLDDTASMVGEQHGNPNRNSAKGYEVIEAAKAKVEAICPGVVSCADILAVAARDSSFAFGGPSWTVKLGRRDSASASRALAQSNLPCIREGLGRLISMFADKGLSARDMVALSGAHTIGIQSWQANNPTRFHLEFKGD